jgi:predicted nucleic acid-binding protein
LSKVITPTILLYEVYKKIKRERTEEEALLAVALMQQSHVVPLDDSIALSAADLCLQYSIPMGDSVVYATAVENKCLLITSDDHFRNLEKVEYIPKTA